MLQSTPPAKNTILTVNKEEYHWLDLDRMMISAQTRSTQTKTSLPF